MAVNYYDGGGDPYSPYFTNINVEPADLAEFADLLDGDLKAIKDTWERMERDLERQASPNLSGSHGIREGARFEAAYAGTFGAQRMLMADLIRGLEIMRDAARMVHDGYVASDAASASQLEAVFAAYERSSVVEALGEPAEEPDGTDGG